MLRSPAAMQWTALALTLLVEGGGFALWAALTGRSLPVAAAALLVNLVVHPIFWRLQPHFLPGGIPALYAAEGAVVLVEAAAYAALLRLPRRTALLLSLALNILSFAAGILLWSWAA